MSEQTKCRYCGAPMFGVTKFLCGSSAMDAEQSAPCRISELTARLAVVEADAERMDWLVSMYVEVRRPLCNGSRALFVAQAESDEEDEVHQTNLREAIDAAMKGGA